MAHIITDAEAQTLTRIAKSLIGTIVRQGGMRKRDMDDAVQELLLAAVRNSDNYNEHSNAGFLYESYARTFIPSACAIFPVD